MFTMDHKEETHAVGFTFQTLRWRGFVLNVFVGTIETNVNHKTSTQNTQWFT
jgi:hypothetical protein